MIVIGFTSAESTAAYPVRIMIHLHPSMTASQLADRKSINTAARKIADAAYEAFVAAGGRAYSQKANDAADVAYDNAKHRLETEALLEQGATR